MSRRRFLETFGRSVALAVVAAELSGTPAAAARARTIEDLAMDLQLVPVDRQPPPPFALESLDGRRVSLADLRDRPALLYFWATW